MENAPVQSENQSSHPRAVQSNSLLYGVGGILLGVLVFILFLLLLNYLNIIQLEKIIPSLSFLPHMQKMLQPNDKVAKVGNETIYGSDFIHRKDLLEQINQQSVNTQKELKDRFLQDLIQESIALQEGQKKGIVELDSTTFNTPHKNWRNRQKLYQIVTGSIYDQLTRVGWDMVQITFSYYGDKRDTATIEKQRIQALDEITAFKSTMDQQKMSSDDVRKLLLPKSKPKEFLHLSFRTIYNDDNLGWGFLLSDETRNAAKKLSENVFSDILPIKIYEPSTQKDVRVGYIIIKKNVPIKGQWNTFPDWYNSIKTQYYVTYY